MSVRSGAISVELKARILEESFCGGVVVSQLARSHGIRPETLYSWRYSARRERRNSRAEAELKTNFAKEESKPADLPDILEADFLPEASLPSAAHFVELVPSASRPASKIAKVSITFASCSLSIDGAISPTCLSQLVAILGVEC